MLPHPKFLRKLLRRWFDWPVGYLRLTDLTKPSEQTFPAKELARSEAGGRGRSPRRWQAAPAGLEGRAAVGVPAERVLAGVRCRARGSGRRRDPGLPWTALPSMSPGFRAALLGSRGRALGVKLWLNIDAAGEFPVCPTCVDSVTWIS